MPHSMVDLALPTNIRPSCKRLPGTDSLSYFEHFKITAVKSFILLGFGMIFTKLLTNVQSSKRSIGFKLQFFHLY
jgi:hypothetical protein